MMSRRLLILLLTVSFLPGCRRGGSAPTTQAVGSSAANVKEVPVQGVPVAAEDKVSLLAFGDWGQDTLAQREVAAGIAAYVRAENRFDAGLLLGDNFYFSLTGVNDPRWKSLFEELYEPKNLRFWAVLGNHDYRTLAGPQQQIGGRGTPATRTTNAEIELEYARRHPDGRFNMPARWYRIDLPPGNPMVTVLMLDSNYGLASLTPDNWHRQTDWLAAQLKELRPTRSDPTQTTPRGSPKWLICCAHHPVYTNGSVHSDDARLEREWLPLFERHKVDIYLTGHNHCMEHLQVPGVKTTLAVSGGGGATLYSMSRRHGGWFSRTYGFTHLTFTPDKAEVRFIDKDGKPVYRFTRSTDAKEHVESTP
jgi:tartrate-resistant acid phosphatase type 5